VYLGFEFEFEKAKTVFSRSSLLQPSCFHFLVFTF